MSYIPKIKCEFQNARCLCQWWEEPCNNGFECHECNQEGKSVHDCYMCTGFVGNYPSGKTSDEVHKEAMAFLERSKEPPEVTENAN